MWLENNKYREIRSALHAGASSRLGKILEEIPLVEKGIAPTRCPTCHKELKRSTLPYLEFFVAACPEFHGWWLSPESVRKMRQFIAEQVSLAFGKAQRMRILAAFLVAFFGTIFLSYALPAAVSLCQKIGLFSAHSFQRTADK